MTPGRITSLALLMALCGSCGDNSFDKRMERECRENTQRLCPIKIEQDTMLDSMAFDRDTHTLHYYYSLHGPLDRKELYTEDVVDAHRSTLIADIRKSVTLKDAKDAKVNFCCMYLSASTGQVLLQYDIEAGEYTTCP